MKNVALLTFFVFLAVAGQAQEVLIDTNYYVPPPVKRQETVNQRPSWDQFYEVGTWFIGVEGGFRTDVSSLSNSLDGLVSNTTLTKPTWGVLAGHTYRGVWTLEAGYVRAPVHLNITIANGSNPFDFSYLNNGYGVPFRVKRRFGSSRYSKKGAVWLTGGGWFIPNGKGHTGNFELIGYSYTGRNRVDTLRLNSTTTISNRITGIAELGLEWTVRLSSYVEMGFYGRKYWGLGNALEANLTYTINNSTQRQATITADGSGWGFGVALHYIYGRQHGMRGP